MKKFTTMLLAIAMLGTMSVNGMAMESRTVDSRAIPCSNCTNGKLFERTEYGKWVLTSTTLGCNHGFPKGIDKSYERTVYITYVCNSCSYSERTYDSTEEREECWGSDYSLQQPIE